MIKWLLGLFKTKPRSGMPPNHIEYNGHTIRLTDEYLNSEEFKNKLMEDFKKIHEIHKKYSKKS